MKEFRIAKCISEDGKSIKRYAIFKDGSRRKPINTDGEGREYFEVDNWIQGNPEMDEFNNGSLNRYLKYSFTGKPKDMLESIKRGDGDVISVIKIFGRIERVLYFLDREYGESLRKQTIEGWKNTKYGYVLYFNSIALDKNSGMYDFERKNIFFDNSQQAIDLADHIVKDAMVNAYRLFGLPYKKGAPYLSFMDDLDRPMFDLIFKQFENIHNEGDIFKMKKGVTYKTLLKEFTIKQEPIPKKE